MLANLRSVHVLLAACALLAMAPFAHAASPCPHLARLEMEMEAPEARRGLLQEAASFAPTFQPSAAYTAAAQRMFNEFMDNVKDCRISRKDMDYDGGDSRIEGPGVFFPAAAWLRFFFHDAGTFDAKNRTGGLNGSIGANCLTENCFDDPEETPQAVIEVADGTRCGNGFNAIGNFYPYDGKHFCCADANKCVGRYASDNGETIPVCLQGSPVTTEMCRGENDGLLPTLSFFRESQRDFPVRGGCGKESIYNRDCFVTLADATVMGTAAVVKQCSNGQVNVPITLGRVDATVADEFLPPLPSPDSIIDAPHAEVFKRMGLDEVDQVTLLTGSHSIGGFRRANSPGLTTCPFVPFDCTPSGQFNSSSFDNNVFKVACDGIQGVAVGECDWSKKCTDTTRDEASCPFGAANTAAYDVCNGPEATFPRPGLKSDIDMCQNKPLFQPHMVEFANDNSKFYSEYKARFLKMANLGYDPSHLTPANFLSPIDPTVFSPPPAAAASSPPPPAVIEVVASPPPPEELPSPPPPSAAPVNVTCSMLDLFGKRLTGKPAFRAIKGITLVNCRSKCSANLKCRSYSFRRGSHTACWFFSQLASKMTVQTAAGYHSGSKACKA